jgi:hypothetical protein
VIKTRQTCFQPDETLLRDGVAKAGVLGCPRNIRLAAFGPHYTLAGLGAFGAGLGPTPGGGIRAGAGPERRPELARNAHRVSPIVRIQRDSDGDPSTTGVSIDHMADGDSIHRPCRSIQTGPA